MDHTTTRHMMPTSQSTPIQPRFIDLSQSEMSVAQHIKEDSDGSWMCELCKTRSNNIMRIVTHRLMLCDQSDSLETISNETAIHLCLLFDEAGSRGMWETYVRLAADSMINPGAPRNQEFPVTPPSFLSREQQAEWTFRRNQAGEIRRIMKTNLLPNGYIDQNAALAVWNSYDRIDFRTGRDAKKLTSYRSLQSRETDDRQRLRVLTAEADKADKADKAREQQ